MKTLANSYQIGSNSDQILWRQPAKHGVAFLPNNKMIYGTNRGRLTVSNHEFLQRQRCHGKIVPTRPRCILNSFRQTAIYREILKGKSESFVTLLAVFQIAKWTFEKVIQTMVYRVMSPIIKGDFVTIATSSGPRTCMVKHVGIITSSLRTEQAQEELLVPNHLLMNNCLWRSGPKNPIVGFDFSFPLSTNIETMRSEVEEIMSGLTFVVGGSTKIHIHDMDRDKKVYNVRITCSIKSTNEEDFFKYRGQIIISFANLLARHV